MTDTLRIAPEFGCGPLWLERGDGTSRANPDPYDLLTASLARRLEAWDERYQQILDHDYPPDSTWPSARDAAGWSADGLALAREVVGELASHYAVVYRDAAAGTTAVLSGPGAPPTLAWRYYLLAPDGATALAKAEEGSGVLLRTVPGHELVFEQVLLRSGEWGAGHHFTEEYFRGTVYEDFVPIEHPQARAIVARWVQLGRQPYLPDVERRIPADSDALARGFEERRATEDRVRRDALPLDQVELARRTLLDGPAELDESWRSGGDRVVVPFTPTRLLADLDDCARIADAFRVGGAREIWAMFTAPYPDPPRRPPGTREGLALAHSATSLRGFHDQGISGTETLLTTERLDHALLRTTDYGLACGSRSFVEAALGSTVDVARRAFAAWADALDDTYDPATMRRIVRRFT